MDCLHDYIEAKWKGAACVCIEHEKGNMMPRITILIINVWRGCRGWSGNTYSIIDF